MLLQIELGAPVTELGIRNQGSQNEVVIDKLRTCCRCIGRATNNAGATVRRSEPANVRAQLPSMYTPALGSTALAQR